jgi:hypothetical protein
MKPVSLTEPHHCKQKQVYEQRREDIVKHTHPLRLKHTNAEILHARLKSCLCTWQADNCADRILHHQLGEYPALQRLSNERRSGAHGRLLSPAHGLKEKAAAATPQKQT